MHSSTEAVKQTGRGTDILGVIAEGLVMGFFGAVLVWVPAFLFFDAFLRDWLYPGRVDISVIAACAISALTWLSLTVGNYLVNRYA